ncbi:tRNA (N(6)-L-threonylcarbamoyladenosine(37)-C(2))-methylthiotransferase MtaB [Caldicellulosiruptoraceae bacterium PP1]
MEVNKYLNTIAFYTLGCKVNQYETEAISELFENNGFRVVDFEEAADVYVINTCTVTNVSDRKSRQIIKKARKLSPDACIVVVGCYAQVYPEELKKFKDIDIIVGTKNRSKIVELVIDFLNNKNKIVKVDEGYKREQFEDLKISKFSERTRAFVKIQEGCEQFCSYCIIPYARGSVVSRKLESIVDEINRLVYNGFKEIVLTGINVSSYGKDFGYNIKLIDVIETVSRIEGVKRLRLSSIEPFIFTEQFIQRITELENVCHHFHISLQSGSNSVLQRMNRHYTTEEYKTIVDKLRNKWPDVAITTDIIVGFPGETEKEFLETYNFVRDIGFSRIHVFRFSPKKGTKAFEMPAQISSEIKEKRSNALKLLADDLSFKFHNQFLDKELDVLFEQESKDIKGYIEGYSNNYIRVLCKNNGIDLGEIKKVKITEVKPHWVIGRII